MQKAAHSVDRREPTFQTTFQVLVGQAPDQKTYTLHEDVFLPRSKFFRTVRSDEWAAADAVTDLTDVAPGMFQEYLHCVHYGSVREGYRSKADRHQPLLERYIFADRMMDMQAANIIVDEIVRRSDGLDIPDEHEAAYVYHNTTAGNPLRRVLVDLLIHEWYQECVPLDRYPKDLLLDTMREFMNLKVQNPHATVSSTFGVVLPNQPEGRYHQHDLQYPVQRCTTQPCAPAKALFVDDS